MQLCPPEGLKRQLLDTSFAVRYFFLSLNVSNQSVLSVDQAIWDVRTEPKCYGSRRLTVPGPVSEAFMIGEVEVNNLKGAMEVRGYISPNSTTCLTLLLSFGSIIKMEWILP
jgi:hypothetical protein